MDLRRWLADPAVRAARDWVPFALWLCTGSVLLSLVVHGGAG